jgi:hypothetical protein
VRNHAFDAVGIHKFVVAIDSDLNELRHGMRHLKDSMATDGCAVQGVDCGLS